jgi:Xaa-Pro aminopeptidase
MSTVFSGQSGALSSGEFRIGDIERLEEIERKQRAVADFLTETGSDALLLQRPANFAWFTTGSDNSRGESTEVGAALFITREARVVVTSNVDSAQLFERDLPRLGFQLKERPWHEPRQTLIDDICRGRFVSGDTLSAGTTDVSERLTSMRTPLSAFECRRMRELGKLVAHAVEATARNCARGTTEAEIAGEAAHRLIRHQILPERIQAWSEDRAARYPHGRFGNQPVERYGTISIVGRRWGLHAAATRTFCFGKPPDELREAYFRATLAQATGMYFCQPNWEFAEVWDRVKRIYEKYGCADEWQNADQAEVIGYDAVEVPLVPRSTFRLEQRQPVFWHPLVGSAIVGDTILIVENGFDLVTGMEEWPRLKVQVKGTRIDRPDILQRPE